MIFVKVVKAVDDMDVCKEYIEGHRKVLKDFGIESISSNNIEWFFDPNVYCYLAYNPNNEMIGGIRIQVADGINSLPVEKAIGKIDPKIHDFINSYINNGGIGELCGLWISNNVRGMGISNILIRSAISTINQLNFVTLTGICAGYSLNMFKSVGFVVNKELGFDGDFQYPNENYVANVVGILNGIELNSASAIERARIFLLRSNPVSTQIELCPKGELNITYDLLLKTENI
jgi:hypothetical protein